MGHMHMNRNWLHFLHVDSLLELKPISEALAPNMMFFFFKDLFLKDIVIFFVYGNYTFNRIAKTFNTEDNIGLLCHFHLFFIASYQQLNSFKLGIDLTIAYGY